MDLIAKKSSGVGFMYGISMFFGFILCAIHYNPASFFVGVLCIVFIGFHLVKYICMPYEIIKADENGILYLPKGVRLDPKDLVDVSYRCARAKGIRYKWGKIILATRVERYTFDYVEDCEEVSKELTRIMYQIKDE